MTIGLNKICLLGNVGQKPEIRTTQDGKEMASFSLATSEVWTDKESKKKEQKTEWHRIKVFSEGLVKVIKSYVDQGSKLYLEGSLRSSKWTDKENKERTTTDVVLQGYSSVLILLDKKGSDEESSIVSSIDPLVEEEYPVNEDKRK